MKKYIKKCFVILLVAIVFISILNINSFVKADYNSEMSSLLTQSDTWDDTTGATTTVNSVMSTIITVVRIVGVTAAVLMLLVLAMKYMSAAPGEKADIKKSAIVYVVGAVVLFAVTGILGIINQFATAVKAG